MPGGFENSAMKLSFSLSSLQPSSASLETPEHVRTERPFNSLRKTCRRDPEKDAWRRSWDRREATNAGEDFWNALKPNYLYLMDCNLIDSCKEAGRDLHYEFSPSNDWSFEQFCTRFTELDLWLASIQDTFYSKEENVTDRNLRLSHLEEMNNKKYKRLFFNNQGGRLAKRCPELISEIKWRITNLNRKWEKLEQTVTPRRLSVLDPLSHAIGDIEHELNCLRKWIRLTERRLPSIKFHTPWMLTELETKSKEHQVIQGEVELHGKIVRSLLKRCDRLVQTEAEAGDNPQPQPQAPVNNPSLGRRCSDSAQALRLARDCERRWQLIYIRSLDWQIYIEHQIKQAKIESPVVVSPVESDEREPQHKRPRLSASPCPPIPTHSHDVDEDHMMEVSANSADMVGPQTKTSPVLNRSGSMQLSADEDLLNQNYALNNSRRQSDPLNASRKLFPDEMNLSTFNKSGRPAINIGTYYCKHQDTSESEQDEGMMVVDSKNTDGSSDEEWTYTNGGVEGMEESSAPNDESSLCQSTETLAAAPKNVKRESQPRPEVIQKLIEGVEQIIPSPARKSRAVPLPLLDANRSSVKVNEWMGRRDWNPLADKTQGESCDDASWEYTSGEEERHSSGDFNASVIHCHQSTVIEDTPTLPSPSLSASPPEHFKISPVVLRAKRRDGLLQRPLSESGLPPPLLSPGPDQMQQSRSESALNQLDQTPTQSVKMDTSVHGTLSSSTTVEEMLSQTQEGSGGGFSTNSLRRRKTKTRKRNHGRKSDSGSDGHEPASPLKATAIVRRMPISGTETEEEEEEAKLRERRKLSAQPMFRLGPEGGKVTRFTNYTSDKARSAESSFSETAWDPYQEKYMSEPYSEENADQDARRILEFGEDYRNFFDSQSESASSLSHPRPLGFHRRRKQPVDRESSVLDSDSEGMDVCDQMITKSRDKLKASELAWSNIPKNNYHLVMATEFAEILLTCEKNIDALKTFLERLESSEHVGELAGEEREIRGLLERWQGLELKSEQLQKMRSLQREMAALREDLVDLTKRLSSMKHDNLQDRDQLEHKIQQIKTEQSNLRERKSQLVEVNVAVHKFFTDSGQTQDGSHEAALRLKEDVNELYLVWEDTNQRVNQELERLTSLSAAWHSFQCHLTELQVALRGDHNTLRLLDSALRDGQDVTSSVKDVAKILNEKQDLSLQFQNICALNSTTPVLLSLPGSTESDSGISDSGSEQESERERRLSALRRLARQLESVLSPDSQAVLDMARVIEQTELELRGLQKTCRELIVRTAVCAADARAQTPSAPTSTIPTNNINRNKKNVPQNFMTLDDPEDDPDPSGSSHRWLWRILRAAFPFQVCILAIFCMACLLEPQCCDSMNNLPFSSLLQLKSRGPPPM